MPPTPADLWAPYRRRRAGALLLSVAYPPVGLAMKYLGAGAWPAVALFIATIISVQFWRAARCPVCGERVLGRRRFNYVFLSRSCLNCGAIIGGG